MYTTMEPKQITMSGACENAHELWKKIQENHEGAEIDLRINALSDFLGFKFRKGETIVEYAGRYEILLGSVKFYV